MAGIKISKPAPQRVEYLDGLRGVAAFFVVIHHFVAAFVYEKEAQCPTLFYYLIQTPLTIIENGSFCVFTFFVLSGFVLSESVAKGKASLPALLLARYFRLTIPMVVSLVFSWILLRLFTGTRLELISLKSNLWLQSAFVYGANVPGISQPFFDGFYKVYLTGLSDLNHVVWTMRKELLGSVVIYFIYSLVPRRYVWWGLALFICITMFGPAYMGFPVGAMLRELWVNGRLRSVGYWPWLALPAAMFVACNGRMNLIPHYPAVESVATHYIFKYNPYFCVVGAGLLVFSILTLPILQRVLSTSVPRFLGRISFALYLVHLPLICSVVLWFDLHLDWPLYPKLAVLFLLLLVFSISAAWLMTVSVDEPLTSRLRHLKKISWLDPSVWASRYFARPVADDPK